MYQLLNEPFGQLHISNCNSYNSTTKLDAVYVPSLSTRRTPSTSIELLSRFSKEIVFVYTDRIGLFESNDSASIRVETIENNSDFLNNYNSRKVNRNLAIAWRPDFDIPHKRSFALSDARCHGYKRIMLLDDDLFLSEDNLISAISALNNGAVIVGFHVTNYPDVSTIDHLERLVLGKDNIISMTGSCMIIDMTSVCGDFVNVYNEDLFFFLSQKNIEKVVSGGCILQEKSLPWLNLSRVMHEQFGDLIYDSLKKRFLSRGYKMINWEEEINERIERIDFIKRNTSNEFYIRALDAAHISLTKLSVTDIKGFIVNSYLPEWIKEMCGSTATNISNKQEREEAYVNHGN